jgi:pimeloyl-ACP methyl ester carboxylesterase
VTPPLGPGAPDPISGPSRPIPSASGRPLLNPTDVTVRSRVDVRETIDGEAVFTGVREELVLAGDAPIVVERTRREGRTRAPVVLVHGFAQNRYTWQLSGRSLVARLAEAGYDVWNVELRGHGKSREAGAGNARNFAEYVDDLDAVLAAIGEPAFVIGHSLGGGVGVGAATRTPLRGLVHIAGLYAFATRNPALRALARASLSAEGTLRAAPVRMSTGWAGRVLARLYKLTDVAGFGLPLAGWAPGSMERELLEERLRLGFDWTSVEVWLEMSGWATGGAFPYAEAFRAIEVPIFVIVGDRDPLLTPADARKIFEDARHPDRTFVEFEPFEYEVHWGHIDLILGRRAPDIVWPQIVAWLDAR